MQLLKENFSKIFLFDQKSCLYYQDLKKSLCIVYLTPYNIAINEVIRVVSPAPVAAVRG
jgi:hypothetical protein